MPDTPATVPIIVPMHLDAICVGQPDASPGKFVPEMYNFSSLGAVGKPFLTQDVERFQSISKNSGVYLHWALPSALTRGILKYRITEQVLLTLKNQGFPDSIQQQLGSLEGESYTSLDDFREAVGNVISDGLDPLRISWYQAWIVRSAGHMTFPALPDRWLVVRVQTDAPNQPPKAWLIQSDYVTSENSYGSASIPWPFTQSDTDTPGKPTPPYYRYLGRVRALDENWTNHADEGSVSELTAIGYGQPSFTGYLPHCQNSFGHYDSLEDTAAATLSYVVVGWFSRNEQDPLHGKPGVMEVAKLFAGFKWTLPDYDPSKPETSDVLQSLSGTYYASIVQTVRWNPANTYIPDPSLGAADVDVVVGRTDAEALAAYLAQKPGPRSDGSLTAEEQLEALQLGILKQIEKSPDAEVLLEQALHTSCFHAENGGSIWQIARPSSVDTTAASAQEFNKQMQTPQVESLHLSPEISDALDTLNAFQRLFDLLQFQNEDQRRQLFYDWYWHLQRKFNPADIGLNNTSWKTSDLINPLLTRMSQLIADLGKLIPKIVLALQPRYGDYDPFGDLGTLKLPDKTIQDFPLKNLNSMAQVLGFIDQQILDQVTSLGQQLYDIDTSYQLQLKPAPRFWRPNEPVLLLVDKTNRRSSRFDTNTGGSHDSLLLCRRADQTMAASNVDGDPATLSATADPTGEVTAERMKFVNLLLGEEFCIRILGLAGLDAGATNSAYRGCSPDKRAITIWGGEASGTGNSVTESNPWHPILLQWEVNFHCLDNGGSYAQSFIADNATLDQNGVELTYGNASFSQESTYKGTVILSRRAVTTLRDQADRYFQSSKNGDSKLVVITGTIQGMSDTQLTVGDQPLTLDPNVSLDPNIAMGAQVRVEANVSDGTLVAVKVELLSKDDAELQSWLDGTNNTPILSQAIYGFNDALITRLKEMQLPVYDPSVTDKIELELIDRIQQAIGRYNDTAPNDLDPYNPIQGGFFEIKTLRFVDVFGQYQEIQNPNLILPHRLGPQWISQSKDTNLNRLPLFPLRIVQPSRLLFRWLSNAGDQAMEMNSHPSTSPICGWVVSNHLDDSLMVYDQDGNLLGAIRADEDRASRWVNAPGIESPPGPGAIANPVLKNFVNSLLSEDPDVFTSFCETIEQMLMTIEPDASPQENALSILMGRPVALVQAMLRLELKGHPAFRLDQKSYAQYAKTGALLDDGFPRVQFPIRLGDLSRASDGLVGYFKADEQNNISYRVSDFQAEDKAETILLSSYDQVRVAMLVDPRAKVHATTGILPVKAIDIPVAQYAKALRQMAFTFAVQPLLTGPRVRIPAPAESDQTWTWLNKTDEGHWEPSAIGKITDRASYPQGEILRMVEGWLKVEPLADDAEEKKS